MLYYYKMINSASLDKIGVFLSGVCVMHCLFTPVLITLLPIIGLSSFAEDILFHQLMLWIVIPTSSIALFIGCRKHRDMVILGTGMLGMVLLVIVAMHGHDVFDSWGEKIATSVAGIILAISHLLNYRACQSITCSDNNCSSDHHH